MNINRHGIRILPVNSRGKVRQCFKVRHSTREAAFDHLVRWEAISGDLTLKVYRCRWCKCFHIGHAGEDKR